MRSLSQESVTSLRAAQSAQRSRREIRDLVQRMVAYNLSMNMLTCSDLTEHQEFYQLLRKQRLIDEQRDDLTQGINQLYEVVETLFRDEEELRNRWINAIGLVVIPFSVLSGIFGMNNLPKLEESGAPLDFYQTIFISLFVSLVLILFSSFRARPKRK